MVQAVWDTYRLNGILLGKSFFIGFEEPPIVVDCFFHEEIILSAKKKKQVSD